MAENAGLDVLVVSGAEDGDLRTTRERAIEMGNE
jgi:hypothetical protein